MTSKQILPIVEDIYLAERYAVALRFHGQPELAEVYWAWAWRARIALLAELQPQQRRANQ